MWVATYESDIGSAHWTQSYVGMEREWIWEELKEGGDYDQNTMLEISKNKNRL